MFKSFSKTVNVTVLSIDTKLEYGLLKSSTGRQLFDQVVKTLAIREIWYFGLQYIDKDGDKCWLKLDKKISSQVELKPKESTAAEFYFRVKYFPEDVQEELIEDVTREFFFSQVRQSIFDGSIYCPPEAAVLLTSYVCQIRLGDYAEDKLARIPDVPKILPSKVLDQHKLTNDEWLERIFHCYKAHVGMVREEAIMEYLKICQDLEMYGINYFQIKNKRGTNLWLGIDSMGLNIYDIDDKLTPKIGFPWGEVKHISYSGKKFLLKPTDKSAKEWHFYVEKVRTNRQILALSIGNHELYMRRRSPESIEVQQMKKKAQEVRDERTKQRDANKAELEALRREVEQNRLEKAEAQQKMTQYERELDLLNGALQREKESRLELENLQEELRKTNILLEEKFASNEDERARLLAEQKALEERVRLQENHLLEQERHKNELNKQLSEAVAQAELSKSATTANGVGDSNNNELNNQDSDHDDDEVGELQVMENYSRREEERNTEMSRNQKVQFHMQHLREDLRNVRDENSLTPIDKRYEKNQRIGLDKFKTLREIRKGNTKKRIDEFEAM